MKEKLKKVWEFVKEHKGPILIATGVVGLGTILYAAEVNRLDKIIQVNQVQELECVIDTKNVDLGLGTTEVLSESDSHICVWVNDLTIDDLGKLGEALVEKLPQIPEHHDKIQVDVNAYGLTKN